MPPIEELELSNEAQIRSILETYQDPYLGCALGAAGVIRGLSVDACSITASLEFGFPLGRYEPQLRTALEQALRGEAGACAIDLQLSWSVQARGVQKGVQRHPAVKNVIAVASGKGGVGKSTVAVNLALSLQAQGARVGMLDADIYGPSQPRMLGMQGKPDSSDGKTFAPMRPYGLQAISIGLMVDEETPMIWRGPMVSQALQQLMFQTRWEQLDYLIIDLPPGTGDIQLTLSQRVPVSGAVIVTTPQDIALLDARKAFRMFQKVEVPVLGVVENMSLHICSQCGHAEPVFGHGGAGRMARDYGIELLGELPLDIRIREQADSGKPTVAADPEGQLSEIYHAIALKTAARLSLRPKDYSGIMPKVVVQGEPAGKS
ncbi:MAG TPA: iron-sulfur cluster carrier protein ApbC [Gammaproteobacteria bacterium]|nr:iron-sulfur cluster carrier protein ApbC [Gammaproteobacteria bacterium]